MSFIVDKLVEVRNDNPDLRSYSVRLDQYRYTLCYDKNYLREVYFIGRPNQFKGYFMSCRTDFKTISHYYDISPGSYYRAVKRYENGVHDRTYFQNWDKTITCEIDGEQRVYSLFQTSPDISSLQLERDLVVFLEQFYQLGLDKLFSPEEPKSDT